jgi:hypothetical protein
LTCLPLYILANTELCVFKDGLQPTDLANIYGRLPVRVSDVDGVKEFDDVAVATTQPGGN